MKCPVCDTQLPDSNKFCNVCGTPITAQAPANADFQQNTIPEPNAFADAGFQQNVNRVHNVPDNANFQKNEKPSLNNFSGVKFISKDEYEIARLSNSGVTNLVSGEGFKVEGAVLTNKRMYYNHKTGIINVHTQEEIVDLKDITGTKIANFNPVGIIILAIFLILAGVVLFLDTGNIEMIIPFIGLGIIMAAIYFITKKSHLRVEYAGGSIYFSVKKYGKENVLKFQKLIHAAKENV